MNEAQSADREFEQLLEYLRQSRGFDFGGYKRPSLIRRVAKRMQAINLESFPDYIDYLEVHPEEFTLLFNTILINVTSFFRDEATWKFLAEEIVPSILSHKKIDAPVRIWSAGCASGEEAYSLAMVMAEALGKEALHSKVKIYATDADEDALVTARQAVYSHKDVQAVPAELRGKYFEAINDRCMLNGELRRTVIFGRHDLVQDAPMSHLDLLVCRNTLMYFNSETQSRILGRFNYAINPGGFLFLGKAEMLLLYLSLYAPVELKYRIFAKASQVNLRDRPLIFGQARSSDANDSSPNGRVRDAVFETGPLPQIVIDAAGYLTLANDQARHAITPTDVGRPFRDIELSYQPAELRSLIDQVHAGRKAVMLPSVEQKLKNGETRVLDIEVVPLAESDSVAAVCITFSDVTRYRKLEEEVESARVESETANEELQSTNEELETMNEEMQSSNEELQTINDELRLRTDELNRSNTFLQSVLSSLRGGVIAVDAKLDILIWNPVAEDQWGLRSDEVIGRPLLKLDIGLPVGKLRNTIQTAIAEGGDPQELILDAVNRRGRRIKCRVVINPCRRPEGVSERPRLSSPRKWACKRAAQLL